MQTAARTTSLIASAALLGALAVAGLTMTISFTPRETEWSPPPITITPHDPPPPTEVRPHTPPPAQPRDQTDDTPLPPLNPQPPATTTGPQTFPPPSIQTITDPHWLRQPRNLQAYYPQRAIDRVMEGVVDLDCLVTSQGALICSVISESPQGWGFGRAALRISQDYRMAPATRDGQPVEARYRMRVPFRLNE